MTTNHLIFGSFDLDLAMIEGSEVEALCGHWFVPTVTVGTSGGAHVPGAAICDQCERVRDVRHEYNALKTSIEQMRARMSELNAEYKDIRDGAPMREEVTI